MFEKIVSGGQTGVDRAALDVALELGIPCGGWCPKDRRAEDGSIPEQYPLRETSSRDWYVRTRRNVKDSDGTLILNCGPLTGGSALTEKYAKELRKPYLIVDLDDRADPKVVRGWGSRHEISVLNVAGPRESKVPGIHSKAMAFLGEVFNQ